MTAAREAYWETRDVATALSQFPSRRTVERHLLRGLAEREPLNDLLGALNFVRALFANIYNHNCGKNYLITIVVVVFYG